jgi:hypothetical protein
MSVSHKKTYAFLHPDGTVMFRGLEKKANWYASRNLVREVAPYTLQFLIEPKGRGRAGISFFTEEYADICVVCGTTECLTKHHIVPRCYRIHLGSSEKHANHYDVALLCEDCHHRYEQFALRLKKKLAARYDDPMSDCYDPLPMRIFKLASSFVNYGHFMPQARKDYILDTLALLLGFVPSNSQMFEMAAIKPVKEVSQGDHGKKIVAYQKDIQRFIKFWRRNFVRRMKPKFLNPHWQVDSIIVSA